MLKPRGASGLTRAAAALEESRRAVLRRYGEGTRQARTARASARRAA